MSSPQFKPIAESSSPSQTDFFFYAEESGEWQGRKIKREGSEKKSHTLNSPKLISHKDSKLITQERSSPSSSLSNKVFIATNLFVKPEKHERLMREFEKFRQPKDETAAIDQEPPSYKGKVRSPIAETLTKHIVVMVTDLSTHIHSGKTSPETLLKLLSDNPANDFFIKTIQNKQVIDNAFRIIFLQNLNQKIIAAQADEKQLLLIIALFTVQLLLPHQIIGCKAIIDEISAHSVEIFILVNIRLDNFFAEEMMEKIDSTDNLAAKVILNTYLNLTTTSKLVKAWCTKLPLSRHKNAYLQFMLELLKDSVLDQKTYQKIGETLRAVQPACDPSLVNALRNQLKRNVSPDFYDLQKHIESLGLEKSAHSFHADLQTYFASLFLALDTKEFTQLKWVKYPEEAIHYQRYLEATNGLRFVSFYILKSNSKSESQSWFNFFTSVAHQSLKTGNLAVAIGLLGALVHPSITRLKLEEGMLNVVNENLFSKYSETLKKLTQDPAAIVIPRLEDFLNALTRAHERENYNTKGHLNFDLLEAINKQYTSIQLYQEKLKALGVAQQPMTFDIETTIKLFSQHYPSDKVDEELDKLSKEYHP